MCYMHIFLFVYFYWCINAWDDDNNVLETGAIPGDPEKDAPQ